MKLNKPRAVASTRHSITVTWHHSDPPTPHSPISRSPSVLTPRQSRTSLNYDDRKTSRSSLMGSMEAIAPRFALMERNEEGWSAQGPLSTKECYTLQLKDRTLGWRSVYSGFRSLVEVKPLAPGDCYQFRLRVVSDEGTESEWSDVLTATTRDDVIAVATLHRAVDSGHVINTRKILQQRPQALEIPNKMGLTPLGQAACRNDVPLATVLLSYGADINCGQTGSWRTPLMAAAYRGHAGMVELLCDKGASWRDPDRSGLTALHYAVDNSQLEVVKMAVEEGADMTQKDRGGWTPLMRGVVLKSKLEVLEYLIDTGSDIHVRDNNGQTLLMQAVLSDRPEVVELLVRKGVDIDCKNEFGHSAYDMAKHSTNKEMLKILGLLGSDPEGDAQALAEKKSSWLKRPSIMLVCPSR